MRKCYTDLWLTLSTMANGMNDVKTRISTLTDSVISLFGIIFLCFLVFVSFSVRPCSDDLYFYAEYLDKGWFNAIWEMGTNIRFTGFLVFNTICLAVKDFQDFPSAFFFYYLLLFSFLYFSTFRLIKTLLIHLFYLPNSSFIQVFNLSSLFIASFYFSTINAQEVWFWTIATTIYLLPIPLIFLAISELIRHKTKRSYFIVGILFFLVGGMVENLVLTLFSLIFVVNVFIWLSFKKIDWRLVLSKITLLMLPFLSWIHSGLGKRIKNEAYYSVENGIFKTLYSDYNLAFNYNRLLMLFLILVLVFYSAFRLKGILKTPSWSNRKMFTLSLLLLLVSFITTFLPMFYVYGNFGPARASLPFFLVLIILIFCWTFLLGLKYQVSRIYFFPLSIFAILMMGIFSFIQQIKTSRFAHEYDKRVREFIKQKNSKAPFLVAKPLPDSGVIPSQELNKLGETPAMTSYYLGRVNGINKDVYLDTILLKKSEK
jgi:hypothetical protein